MVLDGTTSARVLEAIKAALPLANRLAVTARQQQIDAMRLLNLLEQLAAYVPDNNSSHGKADRL